MGFFSDLFGGDSDSGNSTTSSSNTNVDQKQELAAGSIGATASGGGSVVINASDKGAVDSAFKFANATSDSAFQYGGAITDGTLKFANANSDSAFKVVNATVDSAMKSISDSARISAQASMAAQDGAYKLANAATDSALRFGDSTVGQAFAFAKSMQAGAVDELAASGARSNAIVSDAMRSVKNAYGDASSTLADAYKTSKAGEQKIMVAVGLVVVAVVAVRSFGRA